MAVLSAVFAFLAAAAWLRAATIKLAPLGSIASHPDGSQEEGMQWSIQIQSNWNAVAAALSGLSAAAQGIAGLML